MNMYLQGVRDTLGRVGLVRRSNASIWMTGFAIGAGVGLISGAVAALLVTPTNGREMRREIGSRAKRLAERTQRLAERTQGAFSHAKHEVRSELRHGRNEVPIG
jgi:gas vesicle protein